MVDWVKRKEEKRMLRAKIKDNNNKPDQEPSQQQPTQQQPTQQLSPSHNSKQTMGKNKRSFQSLSIAFNNLEKRHSSLITQKEALDREHNNLLKKHDILQRNFDGLKNKLQNNDDLRNEVSKFKELYEDYLSENIQLKTTIGELKNNHRQLAEISRLTKELREKEWELAQMEADNSKLTTKLDEAQWKLKQGQYWEAHDYKDHKDYKQIKKQLVDAQTKIVQQAQYIGILKRSNMTPLYRSATTTNPYDILGISPKSSKEYIRTVYKKLSLIYHPDMVDDSANKAIYTEKFKQISNAYQTLTNN